MLNQIVSWLRLHFQWSVEIKHIGDISVIEQKIEALEDALRVAANYVKPIVTIDEFIPATFLPFAVPEDRAGVRFMSLQEIDEWLSASNNQSLATIITSRAHLLCEFSQQSPAVRTINADSIPAMLEPLTIDTTAPVFHIQTTAGWKRSIIARLFASERQAASSDAVLMYALRERIHEANERVKKVNEDLTRNVVEVADQQAKKAARASQIFATAKAAYEDACTAERSRFEMLLTNYRARTPGGIIAYFEMVYRLVSFLEIMPRSIKVGFDHEMGILIAEIQLPDLTKIDVHKTVTLKSGDALKSATKTETKTVLQKLHPLQLLKASQELANADTDRVITTIAINGWVNYLSKTTGHMKTAYAASVLASAEDFRGLVLKNIDPVAAFRQLKGRSAFVVDDVVPIHPQLVLDRNDPRFTEAREVLDGLGAENNLATMPWEDFEHLIRELFERLYANEGVEVKVTQASRDRGVDAVVFDPDPLRGGKTIIQAKRYVNTVDVSAVRDLYGTLMNEGAARGILVTTSTYGPDAYEFAEGKPLVLINGAGLISYLQEVGHHVRIDLIEARQLNRDIREQN